MNPLAVDLFSGLDGWGEAFVSEGFHVLSVDIVDMRKELGLPPLEGQKTQDHLNIRNGESHTRHLTNPAEHVKNNGGSWFNVAHNTTSGLGQNPDGASNSGKRKAASAQIAKIPFPLARHIARCFLPTS